MRKVTVGILGDRKSGKTCFLTSLLWNLDERAIPATDKGWTIQDCKVMRISDYPAKKQNHIFNFDENKFYFIKNKDFPPKTIDYSIADIEYQRSDHTRKRKVSFIDIPGERCADIMIWRAKDYAEWSAKILLLWNSDPTLKEDMEPFLNALKNENKNFNDLIYAYKESMRNLRRKFAPITPSTFFLDEKGKSVGEIINSDEEFFSWKIWEKGEFIPLPISYRQVCKEDYRRCKKLFKQYKKEVLKPVYQYIDKCDAFIVCVDLFYILRCGPTFYAWKKKEICDFFDVIRPQNFSSLLLKAQNGLSKGLSKVKFLPDVKICEKPKVMFVAMKADLVNTSEEQRNMKKLLETLTKKCVSDSVATDYIAAYSVKAAERGTDNFAIGKYKPGYCRTHNNFDEKNWYQCLDYKMPESWPLNDEWNPADFRNFSNLLLPFPISGDQSPQYQGLDEIFDFVTERK